MELRINDVNFSYGEKKILSDISLCIDGPGFYSILGPNGVGKSTLIYCINNLLTPQSGNVTIDGKDVKSFTPQELAKIIGYIPYSSHTSFPLSVADTVLLGRYPHSGRLPIPA